MKQTLWSWTMLLLAVAVCLVACTPVAGSAGEAQLEGTVWQLVSYVDAQGQTIAVLADSTVTAQFKDGWVGGSAGCNSYGGEYKRSGKRLSLGQLETTLIYCQSEALMDQEQAYLAALESAAAVQIAAGRLQVSNGGGKVLLTFGPLVAK